LPSGKQSRRKKLGKTWAETVDAILRRPGMMGKAAYQDRDEVIGLTLLNECESAVPMTWSEWTTMPHKGGGKPRGKSVNEGRKYDFLDR